MTARIRRRLPPRAVGIGLALVATFAGTACTAAQSGHGSGSRAVTATPAARPPVVTEQRAQPAGAEARFGMSVRRSSAIQYQPGVVIIGGGAAAIRSVTDHGLVWTLDPEAPGVSELRVGSVMAATSLATGRVLHLARTSAGEQVVLGPVTLTDIVRQGSFSGSAPIADPTYAAPIVAAGTDQPSDGVLAPDSAGERPLASAAADVVPPTVANGQTHATPFYHDGDLGMQVTIHHGSGTFAARLALHLDTPTATFRVVIDSDGVEQATVTLHGAASLAVDIKAAQEDQSGAFKNATIGVPGGISVPLGGALPFRVDIGETIRITSQSVGKALLECHGIYKFTGDLTFGYRRGQTPLLAHMSFAKEVPLNQHTEAIGIATAAARIGWGVQVAFSIGIAGASASAWYWFGFGLTVGAATAFNTERANCVADSLSLDQQFGIGYHVPALVAKVINVVLSIFGVHPIPSDGGVMSKVQPLVPVASGYWCPH